MRSAILSDFVVVSFPARCEGRAAAVLSFQSIYYAVLSDLPRNKLRKTTWLRTKVENAFSNLRIFPFSPQTTQDGYERERNTIVNALYREKK